MAFSAKATSAFHLHDGLVSHPGRIIGYHLLINKRGNEKKKKNWSKHRHRGGTKGKDNGGGGGRRRAPPLPQHLRTSDP